MGADRLRSGASLDGADVVRAESAEQILVPRPFTPLSARTCATVRVVGRRLGKPVLMDAEGGDHSHPVLGFDVEADQVVLLAEPLVT
ncbi:hypothetical protein ACF1FX_36070 [Streptomyces sp. NPDC014646]|uniref:hypothetical protein n=1 Tax=unclassified Streptomyces TaxID=2593676 RepID=UPI003702459A